VRYAGEAEIILDLVLGGKLLNVNCPLFVNNWIINGEMKFCFTFASRYPFMEKFVMQFIKEPEIIDISVQSINKFDVMSFVKEEIENLVRSSVRDFMVRPNEYTYKFTPWPAAGTPNPYKGDPTLYDPWISDPSQILPYTNQPCKPYHQPKLIRQKSLKKWLKKYEKRKRKLTDHKNVENVQNPNRFDEETKQLTLYDEISQGMFNEWSIVENTNNNESNKQEQQITNTLSSENTLRASPTENQRHKFLSISVGSVTKKLQRKVKNISQETIDLEPAVL